MCLIVSDRTLILMVANLKALFDLGESPKEKRAYLLLASALNETLERRYYARGTDPESTEYRIADWANLSALRSCSEDNQAENSGQVQGRDN